MGAKANPDKSKFGLVAQATQGTFEDAGTATRYLLDARPSPSPQESVNSRAPLGSGQTESASVTGQHYTFSTSAVMQYSNLLGLYSVPMRETSVPSAVTIIGTSDITIVLNGTHKDGSTGTQIQAPAGTFDSLITYGGVTASTHPNGGAERLFVELSGSADAKNNTAKRIKAVHETSGAKIDIDESFVAGSAGDTLGAPMAAVSGESITLKVGRASRNRYPDDTSYYSGVLEFPDMSTGGRYFAVRDLHANSLQLGWSGQANLTAGINWSGVRHSFDNSNPFATAMTDPSTTYKDLTSDDVLKWFAIVKASTAPYLMSCVNVQAYDSTLSMEASVVTDLGGCATADGVREQGHTNSGSVTFYHVNDSLSTSLEALGANKEIGDIVQKFEDKDGNRIYIQDFGCRFGQWGGMGDSGAMSFTGVGDPKYRMKCIQEIAA